MPFLMDFVWRASFKADEANTGAGVEAGCGLASADGAAADDDDQAIRQMEE